MSSVIVAKTNTFLNDNETSHVLADLVVIQFSNETVAGVGRFLCKNSFPVFIPIMFVQFYPVFDTTIPLVGGRSARSVLLGRFSLVVYYICIYFVLRF